MPQQGYLSAIPMTLILNCVVSSSAHSQVIINSGFEIELSDTANIDQFEPYVIIPSDQLTDWEFIDINEEGYRECHMAYDTSATCPVLRKIRSPFGITECDMTVPFSGKSSLFFSPVRGDEPWIGNDGMYVYRLNSALHTDKTYCLSLQMRIEDHYNDSVTIAGINVYTIESEVELQKMITWDPDKFKEEYELAQYYPKQLGQYWLARGRHPTMEWIEGHVTIQPTRPVTLIVLGVQRGVPDDVPYLGSIQCILDEFVLQVCPK